MELKIFKHEADKHDSESIQTQFDDWVRDTSPTILTMAANGVSPYPGDNIQILYILYETET
jgi:hypothetical protein